MGPDHFDAAAKYNPAMMSPPMASTHRFNDGSPEGANSAKKGRSKACDDCRKSKRRCIHDENGRVDPIKAQERSKPRATNSAKRPRPNEEDAGATAHKKPKQESASPLSRPVDFERKDGEMPQVQVVIPPSHAQKAVGHDNSYPASTSSKPSFAANMAEAEQSGALGQTSYASPPTFKTDTLVPKDVESMGVSSQLTASLVSPPTSHADETDVPEHADGEGEHAPTIHTPTSSSRHSSRQPRHAETQPTGKVSKSGSHSSARHASFAASASARKTPPGPGPSKKPTSRPSSSHTKKSMSPMAERHGTSTHSKHEPTDDPDPETSRLIKELQGQEFGLRKRTART